MPICFKRIRAANREPSSTVSHRVIRWSEGKMEGLYVCMCVCVCGSGLHKSFENREREYQPIMRLWHHAAVISLYQCVVYLSTYSALSGSD